jgi:hypothetical protein
VHCPSNDQAAGLGAKVVSGTPRDSLHMIDVLYARDGGQRPDIVRHRNPPWPRLTPFPAEVRPSQIGNPMNGPISRNRLLGSLTEAASWRGADRNTVVTLAATLVAARADAEGSRYFQDLARSAEKRF